MGMNATKSINESNLNLGTVTNTLISFEFLFVLFLFSGVVKELYGVNILLDTTFVLMILVSLSMTYLIYRRSEVTHIQIVCVILLVLFLAYTFMTGLFINGENYFMRKMIGTSTTILAFFSSVFVIATRPVRVRKLIQSLYLFSIISGIVAILKLVFLSAGSLQELVQYQLMTLLLGIGFILSFHYTLMNRKKIKKALIYSFLTMFFILMLSSSGGRGPFISSIIANVLLLITVFISNKTNIKKLVQIIVSFFSIILTSGFIFSYLGVVPRTIERILITIDSPLESRLMYYPTAIRSIINNPLFGIGFGGWPSVWDQVHDHPHNLLLEVTTELGLAGLFLFTLVIVYPLSYFRPVIDIQNSKKTIIILLLVYLFIWRMVSGDLTSDRFLFTFIGLLIYPSIRHCQADNIKLNLFG
ncbi:O-antigen ligase family protein [Halorubrum sp. F4]|uniref:O-antigen ligase family protein n=1 Tax=Halorubrum sp. F4 TaxID=2989715 RepID=UPI0034E06D0E